MELFNYKKCLNISEQGNNECCLGCLFVKAKIICLFALMGIMISFLIIGCSGVENSGNDKCYAPKSIAEVITKETTVTESNQEVLSVYPINRLKDTDVEWITKKGGLPSDKKWGALYSQKDEKKIEYIISLVKSSSHVEKANQYDINTLGYPVDIVIRMKDGNEFTLRWAMKLTTNKVSNGTETRGTLCDDRFILAYGKGEALDYYVVYSKDATEYINKLSDSDFPRVPVYTIKPEKFKNGDMISISGSGCTDNEVNIMITNGNDVDKEEYVFGKVKPVYGEWKWDGVIDKNIKNYEGKDIFLKNEKYFLCVQIGEHRYISGQSIIFTDYIFEKDKIDENWKETVTVSNCSVKSGPGKDYKDIGNFKYGDTVLLVGGYGGWYLAKSDKLDEFWIEGKNVVNYDYNKDRVFGVLTADEVVLGQIRLYKGNLV